MGNEDCIFCRIVRREIPGIFKESENFIAIRDIHPKAEGHTLIIPKKHFVTMLDIEDKIGNEMLKFCKEVASELIDKKIGDGFNVIMNNLEPAGQVVKHAHIHIIPRNEGDGLKSLV